MENNTRGKFRARTHSGRQAIARMPAARISRDAVHANRASVGLQRRLILALAAFDDILGEDGGLK